MGTRVIKTTETWQEITTNDCLIQNISAGEYFIKYSDTFPEDGFNNSFVINTSGILNLPAPLSGSIYVASKNNARIAVEDF